MPDLDPIESVAASGLVSAALIGSLIPTLVDTGILSGTQAREVYENALFMIESQQGGEPALQGIYEAARKIIEDQLRPHKSR